MRDPGSGDTAQDLTGDVENCDPPADRAFDRERDADRRVEMRARHRPKDQDEDGQHRAGRQRVAEQGERHVPAGQPLGHDAGADHRGEQQGGAERFGERALAECRIYASAFALAVAPSRRPIPARRFCKLT